MTLPIKAFILRGPFSQDDFAILVEAVRRIDDRHPHNNYELVAVDAQETALSMADKILREAISPKPDRVTEFWTVRANEKPGG